MRRVHVVLQNAPLSVIFMNDRVGAFSVCRV